MGCGRARRILAATMTALLLFQATPGGMLTAYAANNGITVSPKTDELKAELAAKTQDYPAGAFAFYEANTSIKEGESDREVRVVRWGDTSAQATVDVKVFALTATYGEDFEVYTTRGLVKDVLSEEGPKDADTAAAEDAASADAETASDAATGDDDATDASSSEAGSSSQEEQVPFTATGTDETAEASEPSADVNADAAQGEDGISSMRDAYAIQTGKDTKRTDWRGEYEESIAPVAAVEAANGIASELPGATGTLTFEPGEYVKTVCISVKDDDRAESDEAFKLMLGSASVGVLGGQMQHTVTIEDNEEAERIAFAMKDSVVTVEPGAEYAELTVVRTSGKDYYAGAVVGTAAGTATPETSYEAVDNGVVSFASGATEQTIQIPLKETAQAGTEFTVRLDADSTNIDGAAETIVKIGDDAASATAGAQDAADDATDNAAVPMATSEDDEKAAEPAAVNAVAAPRYEHNGVVYDGVRVDPWWTASADGVDASASFTYKNTDLSDEATRIVARINVWGSTNWSFLGTPAYKNWSMAFGGRTMINGRDCDSKDVWYTEQFNITYNESKTGGLYLKVNTDGTNYHGRVRLEYLTYYYPRYTVTMNESDFEQTLVGRNYTSTTKSTTFKVNAINGDFKSKDATVAHDGYVNLRPDNMTDGVRIKKYEIYAGKDKIGETSGSFLHYSDLNELRKNYESKLETNKFKISVKPVYEAISATVTFETQDASAIDFSGRKSGSQGFKAGDKLEATQIDTLTITAECPTDQKVKPLAISRYESKFSWSKFKTVKTHVKDYRGDGGLKLTVSKLKIDDDSMTLKAMHDDATLTYEYTPSEADAVNATWGAVAVYDPDNLSEPLGVSNYEQPLTLRDSLEMIAGNSYVARVMKGDGFMEGTVVDGISYSTRTIWTYTDPTTGQKQSSTGNAFMFDPYYGDEVVNYHFKNVQDDRKKAGVTGTVYIQEKPLFSTNAKQTSKPAVGVQLDVGGENAKTDQSGTYTIDPVFNKSDYVSAFLTYDSLTMMSNVAISQDTVKDFYIDVDERDALKVSDSSIYKLTNTGEKDMSNNDIYEQRKASSVLLEDAMYTFTVNATGSAGVTPGKAEFYFYDKSGNRLDDKTQTATFNGATAELKLNPQTLNLSVGDSMTVKLFDTKGNGYFEHQTSVILGKKAEGVYTFNYEGIKQEDDNLFLKAVGGISMGYDFVLDMLSANAGTYEDETGAQHQLMFIGFGNGFQNQGSNAESEVYKTLQQAIANIDEVNTNAYSINANDNIAFFGSGSWSFDISLGIIYDMVMEDTGDRKGEFKFSDYLMMVDASAGYNKEWKVPVGPVNLTFNLQFGFGDSSNGTSGVSVKWHFYDPDDEGYFVEDNAAINLLFDENIDSKGYFGLDARVLGSLRAEFLGDLIGGEGALTVQVGNRTAYDSENWNDYGEVLLTPKVKLVVLGIGIPVWSKTWRHEWSTADAQAKARASAAMMNAIDEGMSADNILFTSTDGADAADFSYAENRSGWNSGGMSFFNAFKAAESADEDVLQTGFLTDSDISLCNLGSGMYLAAFLDVVPGRDDANKMGAYYSVYDGSAWSKPVLLNDDGTEDQVPTISDAGEKGVLIAWSSAGEELNGNADLSDRLNQFNIEGVFYKDGKLGDVMQITKNTDEDHFADTDPQAVYYETADDKGRIKLYYTKSEFTVSKPEEGEVVGDLLNPDQLNLVREYDVASGEWVSTYDAETEAGIRAKLKGQNPGASDDELEELYEKYVTDWYGQVFLDLAPAVDITETLDENGNWSSDPVITPLDSTAAGSRMVKDSDAIAYNGLGLLAYSLDKGGMAQTTGDQNLYLQIFNAETNEYHHPVMISGVNAEISDIQFMRSTYLGTDEEEHPITWLYWKEQASQAKKDEAGKVVTDESGNPVMEDVTSIKRIDISTLVGNKDQNLILNEDDPDHPYYYINKAESNAAYAPEQVLVSSTPESDDGSDFISIDNFQVKSSADGRYNFIVWTQGVNAGEGDEARQELQLFAVREDLHSGEVSAPVQLTDKADQYIAEFDFAVTDDGDIDVLAGRQTLKSTKVLDEDGEDTGVVAYEPDPATSELASMHITPSREITVDDAVEGALHKSDDDAVVDLSTTIHNEGFEGVEKINIVAVDNNGAVVYSSKDEVLGTVSDPVTRGAEDGGITFEDGSDTTQKRGLITLGGGEQLKLTLPIPVSKAGVYDVTVRVTADGKEIATKQFKGQVPVKLSATGLNAEVLERNKVELSATISNETVLAANERTAAYGYIDSDGNQVELGTVTVEGLEPGASTEFSVELDQDFATFESKVLDDGSLRDSRRYYLDLEPESKAAKTEAAATDEGVIDEGDNSATIVYGEIALTATASQVSLMGKAKNLGAKLAIDDGEGGVKAVEAVKAGEYAELALTVDGVLAQDSEELINGYKVVWDEVDNDIAKVERDGTFLAKKSGTVKLTGKVMPANTEVALDPSGVSVEVDNYDALPASLIKTIEVTVTDGVVVSSGGTGGTDGTGGSNTGNVGGNLPNMGDVLNPLYIIVITAAGIVLITAGVYVRRRRNEKKGR